METTKENFEKMLQDHPDITQKQLAVVFGCSPSSINRHLRRFGLRTKPWNERKHSPETRKKISRVRIERGLARGSKNPNAGVKCRPWLEGDRHPLRQWHRENPDFGERQRGAANPVHQVRHLYDDPEYISRITVGLRAHVDQRRGSTYEEVYGPEKAAQYKQKLRDASPARLAKFSRRETAPEKAVREILEGLGVPFSQEAPVGCYTVDFLIERHRLVIQADGDYWHAHPEKYPNPSRKQRERRRLDASCDAFLENRGFRVLRLWESELRANPRRCRKRIEEILHG